MENCGITDGDILKLFPLTRQLKELEIISGMSYSRIIQSIKNKRAGKPVDYCDLFIIEFYMRVKSDNMSRLIEECKHYPKVRDETIIEKLFEEENFKRFERSSVRWKVYFLSDIRKLPEIVFNKIEKHLRFIIEEKYKYREERDDVFKERRASLKAKKQKIIPPKDMGIMDSAKSLAHL